MMSLLQFLAILLVAFGVTFLLTLFGLVLFPGFVSREKKVGQYRVDDIRQLPPTTTKLPALGGPAAALGISIALLAAHYAGLFETDFRWFLVPVWLFTLIGFIDDYLKFRRSSGLPERTRLNFILIGSLATAMVLYFRLGYNEPHRPLAYISYFLNPVVWFFVFNIFATGLTTVTVISVGFSDGVDGLLGGLWLIAATAYAVIGFMNEQWIGAGISASLAGSALAFLTFNAPSNWSSRRPRSERKARVYAGESGAMFVGAAFAMLSLLTLTEFHWFIIGGVFVLEGTTALYQAKIATPIFRRFLKLPRFASNVYVPHIEFPLPFLATPLHCHLDLLGVGRLTVVKMLYTLAAVFGALGVWILYVDEFAVKVFIYLLGIALMVLVWIAGAWTKTVFLAPEMGVEGPEQRITLYQGRPLRFGRFRFYWPREVLDVTMEEIQPMLDGLTGLTLWHPLMLQDAQVAIAQMYARTGRSEQALNRLNQIPQQSLMIRPQGWQLFQELQRKADAAGMQDEQYAVVNVPLSRS
jgi:UDP-N-acetylmuramyl pentapeptide phosphotransferase/UDP-N-acetylglucosamine-1-phosphate transferase